MHQQPERCTVITASGIVTTSIGQRDQVAMTGSERVDFDAEVASRAEQSLVVARQTNRLAVALEELQ